MNVATKNKIFDLILADALEECLDEELKKYDELNKPHEFSEEYKRKMRKITNSVGRKDRIKIYKRIAVRSVVSIAAAFGIVFGVLLTQPEVFAAVKNVFKSVFDKYDKYEYVGDEITVEKFDDSFRLGYVPDGYMLSNGVYSPAYVVLTYENGNKIIEFKYGIANNISASYDNEHNIFDTFTVDGNEYYYYESNNKDFNDSILWYDSGYSFGLNAQLSKEEFVKIAENIIKWKDRDVFFPRWTVFIIEAVCIKGGFMLCKLNA